MTFDRVLIYPHGPFKSYIKTGNLSDVEKSRAKSYVAVTRAKQSVGIAVPDKFESKLLPFFPSEEQSKAK